MKRNQKMLWISAVLYGTALILFTSFVLLDTFVLPKGEQIYVTDTPTRRPVSSVTSVPETNSSGESENESDIITEPETEPVLIQNDTLYYDGNIRIEIITQRVNNTTVHIADVRLSSPEYLRTAFAKDTYGRNIKEQTSVIAARHNAFLAVNGDFYGYRDYGYVIRGGVLYRSKIRKDTQYKDLVIYEDGAFETVYEQDITADELMKNGAWDVLSFGPALVENGKIAVNVDDEVTQSMTSNPRTAIGICGDLHYVFVVSDGRTSENQGLSLYQLAQVLADYGCKIAYNLDGGGSATMYFNGKLVNQPTDSGGERRVSDIVYIGY